MWVMLNANDPEQREYFKQLPYETYNYCVGFFTPDGMFVWHYDFQDAIDALKFVNYLNGGEGRDLYESKKAMRL